MAPKTMTTIAGMLLLAACQTTPEPQRVAAPTAPAAAQVTSQVTSQVAAPLTPRAPSQTINRGMPSRDEQACLQAVSIQTNNEDVMLLTGTETSEANNTVYIGVGPNRARWRCLVKNGRVAEVTSLTNEGRL